MVEFKWTYVDVPKSEFDKQGSVVLNNASIECQINAGNAERGNRAFLSVQHSRCEVFNANA